MGSLKFSSDQEIAQSITTYHRCLWFKTKLFYGPTELYKISKCQNIVSNKALFLLRVTRAYVNDKSLSTLCYLMK